MRSTTANADRDDDRRDTPSDDSDSSPEERRHSSWLDKDRAVKKRMARFERNLKKQFDQQRADDQAAWQREKREMADELEKLRLRQDKDQATADDAQHEREMSELVEQQAAAYEAGDTAKAASIGRKMAEKAAAHMQAKTEARLGQQRKRADEGGGERGTQQQGARPGRTKAQQFVAKNADWWDDNAAARGYANELFSEASKRGEDLESDALFERIAKKLKKQFPKLKLRGLDDDEDEDDDFDDLDEDDEDDEDEEREERRPAAVQSFRRRAPDGRRRSRGTHITPQEEDAMREIGLDPSNDKHVLQWVNEGEALEGNA